MRAAMLFRYPNFGAGTLSAQRWSSSGKGVRTGSMTG